MSNEILENYLFETIGAFRSYQKLAEKAFAQVSDAEFYMLIDAESNSVAAIAKHVGGNLRSRWTDFLTTDGEKTNRNRDAEFVAETDTREDIQKIWETGWHAALTTLEALTIADLNRIVTIRGEKFTVVKAISRSLAHTAYHVGQIAFLAKHLRAENWKTLSVPKNQSEAFTDWLKANDDKGNYLEATEAFAKKDLK